MSISKLNLHLERAMCEMVAVVGVDINKAVKSTYYAALLPFLPGLGPRKAELLLKKINQTFVSRHTTRCMPALLGVCADGLVMHFLRARVAHRMAR